MSHLRFAVLAFALISTACGKQAEGERCDLNSGSLDCETGLICRSADQLSINTGRGWALCCPPDDVQPTVEACRAGARLPDEPDATDAGVPATGDGGT
jgi:hypothetical protein